MTCNTNQKQWTVRGMISQPTNYEFAALPIELTVLTEWDGNCTHFKGLSPLL